MPEPTSPEPTEAAPGDDQVKLPAKNLLAAGSPPTDRVPDPTEPLVRWN